jgi:hypothetical protein
VSYWIYHPHHQSIPILYNALSMLQALLKVAAAKVTPQLLDRLAGVEARAGIPAT